MFLCPLSIDFAGHTWLAEWIAGIGQALGAAFTFGAVYVALRSERRIDERRRQDAENAELADARLISVHVTLAGHRQQPPGTTWWQVALRNDSPGVITNVQLEELKIDGKPVPKWKVDAGAGLVTGPPKAKSQEVPWLEPHKAMQWVVWCLNDEGGSVSFPNGEREAVVRFVRDGWTWSRSNLGAPQKVPFDGPAALSLLNPRPASNMCESTKYRTYVRYFA